MYSLTYYTSAGQRINYNNLTKEVAEKMFKELEQALSSGEMVIMFEGPNMVCSAKVD